MSQYLDVLGTSFWLPDPDSAATVARDFAAIRDNIQDTQHQLQALRSSGSWSGWTGQAADTFAGRLGKLPTQLSRAHESYATVAAALSGYAGGIRPVVSALVTVAREADEAESTLRIATTELQSAQHAGDHATAAIWETRVRDDTAAVEGLRHQLKSLLSELDSLSARCVQLIGQGQHAGIENDLATDIDRYVLMDGGTAAGNFLRFEGDLGKGELRLLDSIFIQPFTKLEPDLARFVEHRNLHNGGELLQDVGDAVGAIGLVAGLVALTITTCGVGDVAIGGAVISLGGVAGEIDGVDGAVGIGDYLGEAAIGMHIDALAANAGAMLNHEDDSSWIDVSNSALSVAADGAALKIEGKAQNALFSVGSGLEISTFTDGLKHEFTIPEDAAGAPDVVTGLHVTSGAVQGLQGLPVVPGPQASGGAAAILQPAVSLSSPAVVNIQHNTLSQPPGDTPGSSGSGLKVEIQ